MGKMKSINDSMEDARIIIWNSHEDEIINARMAPFGYDETRHLANKALYNETNGLIAKNDKEHAEWRKASEIFNTTLDGAKKKLKKIRQYLKFWYDADSPEAIDLGLYNDNIVKYADFKYTATNFYAVLLGMDAVLTKLIPFGYTTETITQQADEVA
jgi:hypothetical protein